MSDTHANNDSNDVSQHATEHMASLICSMSDAMIVVQELGGRDVNSLTEEERIALKIARNELRSQRRKIRNRLFRIRDAVAQGRKPDPEYDSGLKAWIEIQFQQGMQWVRKDNAGNIVGGFTFEWDVACNDPLKVIRQFAWDGMIERRPVPEMKNGQPTGRSVIMDVCDPAAFTQQG